MAILLALWASASLHVADRYWSGLPDPCPHTYVALIADGGSPLAGQWTDPNGACIVWVNTDAKAGPREFCKLIVHEVGHLRGLQHSTNPLSVMYPQPTRVPAGCKHLP